MNHPKVLLCAPTNSVKNYCLDDYIKQLTTINYPEFDVVLCDNSPTKKNAKLIESKGVRCLWSDPSGRNNIVYITESQELLRMYAIKHGYDYMFMLESDVFVPYKSIIQLLMLHKKPVVSAMYHILTGAESHLMLQQISADPKMAITYNIEAPYDFDFVDGSLKKVFGAGLGCTLIHKSVFEKIAFRYELGKPAHSDTFWAHDLHKEGIDQFVDTSLLCEHRNQDWTKLKIV